MTKLRSRRIRTDLIRIRLAEMRDSIKMVQEHLPRSYEEFQQLGIVKDGIYRRTEFAIENILDICAILNTDLELGVPAGDDDILGHLQADGILPLPVIQTIRSMKAIRNIVVHRYGVIDDAIAFALLLRHINDFDVFRSEIESFLKRFAQPHRGS